MELINRRTILYFISYYVFIFFWYFSKKNYFSTFNIYICRISCFNLFLTFSPQRKFLFITFRAFEICFGILSALIYNFYNFKNLDNNYKNYFSLLGIFLIFLSIFIFNEDTLSPGLISILPITGCVIIILFCDNNTFIYKILSYRPLVFTGLISYSLYLWHVPILNFYKIIFSITSKFDYIIIFSTVFLISIVTWKYIEKPFRNFEKIKSNIFFSIIFFYLVIYITLIVGLHLILDSSKKQFSDKLDQDKLIIYNQTQLAKLDKGYDKMFDNNKCKFWSRKLKSDFKKRFDDCFFELNKKQFF